MQKATCAVLAALAILAVAGCKDSTTGPSAQGLQGSWRATKAEFTSVANPSTKVDIVAQGSTVTLVLAASTFTLTITDQGQSPKVTAGSWTSSMDTMTLKPSGVSFDWTFDMNQSGNTLTLSGANVNFDFGADGTMEEAKLNMVLTR